MIEEDKGKIIAEKPVLVVSSRDSCFPFIQLLVIIMLIIRTGYSFSIHKGIEANLIIKSIFPSERVTVNVGVM